MNTTTQAVEVPFPQAFTHWTEIQRACFRVPPGTEETVFHPLKESIWPLGENALSCEILRWLSHCFLVNTVVFLPVALRHRTHRNAIWLSRCSREYSTSIRRQKLAIWLGIEQISLVFWLGSSPLRRQAIHPRLKRARLSGPFPVNESFINMPGL